MIKSACRIMCYPWVKKETILNFAVDEELLERLDDFRFGSRIKTQSEAIRRLSDEALKKYEKETKE